MNHKDLDVWKKGMDLVELVYNVTSNFPDSERFGLTSQMRRASISIPSNIAEGSARKSNKEFYQYISIALGSLAELETQYLISVRLNFVNEDEQLVSAIKEQKQLLIGFRNHIKKHLTTNF